MHTYRIVRRWAEGRAPKILDTDLTLDQVREHCRDPESSSTTASQPSGLTRTARDGAWFDTYEEE